LLQPIVIRWKWSQKSSSGLTLFHWLKVFSVFSPDFRDRASDIPVLVRHFVEIHNRRMSKARRENARSHKGSVEALEMDREYTGVGEFMKRAVPLAELELQDEVHDAATKGSTHQGPGREDMLALREARGHISGDYGAAARLRLKRTTLNSKLKKLGTQRMD
jgi:formate hydrogenlyase transcriptional activator